MESTSDYWRSWFSVLETADLEVQLVDASQARNLPGRPKTGKAGAQWIARLTEMGLLHLTQDRTRCWQRLEETLEDAMCKLTSVISKLAGSVSGRAMIEAMIAGERDPQVLADLAQTRIRPKKPELAKAFTGMRFEDQHVFAAAAHLRAIDFLGAEIAALEVSGWSGNASASSPELRTPQLPASPGSASTPDAAPR